MSNGSANRFSLMRGPSGWGLAAVLGNREGDRMGNLLFWLGIGAAQKGAGSKPIVRRHWVVSFVVGILAITNAIVVHGRGCLSTCVEV